MTKILIILVIAFSFEAIGIITLKRGLDRIGPHYTERKATMPLWQNILKLVGEWFTNKDVLLGLLLETIFFILLQYLLGARDVSYVWPLTAMSFVMTTLAAQFILHERVDGWRWGGVALIVLGAVFISYGEHNKPKAEVVPVPPPEAAQPPLR
ncbi:MAG: EamA family transporter [Verrucomicrobia bacterium]|nr:EamA family transporter [Verrucomicrobiota bacterium]